jgi:quercetin dioxygenase-like cupin family protein
VREDAWHSNFPVRLSNEVSGGALTVLETVNAVGTGPPLHRHHKTEVFRVLDGEYLYEVDGRRFRAVTGDVASVPVGAAHTFTNISSGPARQLVMMLPAMDARRFFTELGELMARGRPDMATLNAFGARGVLSFWGLRFTRRSDRSRRLIMGLRWSRRVFQSL